MKLKPCAKPWSLVGIRQILLIALFHGFLLHLTLSRGSLIPSFHFHIATFIPVVGAFVFGLPGAIGGAIGNFLGNIGGRLSLELNLLTAINTFFFLYMPYRMWYALRGNDVPLFIHNRRSFACYAVIQAMSGFCFASLFYTALEVYHDFPASDLEVIVILFGANFLVPMLIGTPILFFLQSRQVTFYYPKPQQSALLGYQKELLLVLTVLHILSVFVFHINMFPPYLCGYYVIFGFLILAYICTVPSGYVSSGAQNSNFVSLTSGMSANLLIRVIITVLLGAILIKYIGDYDIYSDQVNFFENRSDYYFKFSCIIILGFYAIFVFLYKMEKDVTDPLSNLSIKAASFVETGKINQVISTENLPELKTEIDVLEASFNKMSRDVQRYVQNLLVAKKQEHAMQAQMDVAIQIQQGTLPNLKSVNDWLQDHGYKYHIAGGLEAARNVGGDIFDCYVLDDSHLYLSIGDVSGKGVPAALFAMVAQAILGNTVHNVNKENSTIGDMVRHTNDVLVKQNKEVLFVTLWAGILDLDTGILSYVNAGHNPPIIYDSTNKQISWVSELSGPVLGLMPESAYEVRTVALPGHGRLLLYTDGFNEAENIEHEFYGNDRLQAAFAKNESPAGLVSDVKRFVGYAHVSDDKTYVWLSKD